LGFFPRFFLRVFSPDKGFFLGWSVPNISLIPSRSLSVILNPLFMGPPIKGLGAPSPQGATGRGGAPPGGGFLGATPPFSGGRGSLRALPLKGRRGGGLHNDWCNPERRPPTQVNYGAGETHGPTIKRGGGSPQGKWWVPFFSLQFRCLIL